MMKMDSDVVDFGAIANRAVKTDLKTGDEIGVEALGKKRRMENTGKSIADIGGDSRRSRCLYRHEGLPSQNAA